jgi:hypothetical protein
MSLKYDIECVSSLTVGTKGLVYNRHGKPHRINGPAVIWEDADFGYFQFGDYHRDSGVAFFLYADPCYFRRGKEYVMRDNPVYRMRGIPYVPEI